MHKTGPFTNSGVSKFVKLVVVYIKHQQLNNTKNYLSLHTIHYLKLHERSNKSWVNSEEPLNMIKLGDEINEDKIVLKNEKMFSRSTNLKQAFLFFFKGHRSG